MNGKQKATKVSPIWTYRGQRWVLGSTRAWMVYHVYRAKSSAESALRGFQNASRGLKGGWIGPKASMKIVRVTGGWALVQSTNVSQYITSAATVRSQGVKEQQ